MGSKISIRPNMNPLFIPENDMNYIKLLLFFLNRKESAAKNTTNKFDSAIAWMWSIDS